jgi:hypothetical protein
VQLIHTAPSQQEATTITLRTDSNIVYYVLNSGKGATIRQNVILQELYVAYYKIKNKRGHRLVVWWVPTDANLVDPISRGVITAQTQPDG